VDTKTFLLDHRVGHLATASADGVPHVIPVCYAVAGDRVYIALDEKPKHVAPTRLRRVRNLLTNPAVSLVVDDYDEDWSRLAYVLVHGLAELLSPEDGEHAAAVRLLRDKYSQYRAMAIGAQPVIAITILRLTAWQGAAAEK
jgi:PPOX class probable F420-dependent enzyme